MPSSFGAHRYWRLVMPTAPSNTWSFAEVQFRTTPGTPLLFSGGTATASSYYQSNATYAPSQATDNNTATFWGSNDNSAGQWWQYDYGVGVTKDIQEVTLTSRPDSSYTQTPTLFNLQYSDNGSTWTNINPAFTATWSSATQTQVFTTPSTAFSGTVMAVTQVALEQWASIIPPNMQVTQAAIEHWASTARVNERRGGQSAVLTSTGLVMVSE